MMQRGNFISYHMFFCTYNYGLDNCVRRPGEILTILVLDDRPPKRSYPLLAPGTGFAGCGW